MKRNTQPKLDMNAPLVLETYIPGQDAPIEIHGLPELLVDLNTNVEQARVIDEPKPRTIASTAIKAATEPHNAPYSPIPLTGREALKATIKARLFDLRWGTKEYEELELTRMAERKLRLRTELGIVTMDRCAKHQKQLAHIQ